MFNYDGLGRASTVKTTLRGHKNVLGDHWEKITYDQYSRPWKTWDAARNGSTFTNNGIEQKYDAFGYPYQILDAHTGTEYYRVEAIDDRGNVSEDRLGDGVIRRGFEHDPDTGRLTDITAYDVQNRAVQDLTLEWDSLGNLETRHEKGINKQGDYRDLWESFGYDNLNRLTDYTVSGDGNHITSVKYNALGNITYKSDVGHYSYNLHDVRPHAVKWAGSDSYSYDGNGSVVIDGRGRIFTYTAADQVSRITKGGHTTNFHYDANRSRYKRVDTNGSSITTTLYLGGVEKIHHADNTQEWRRYIHDSVMITQVLNTSGSVTASRTQFLLKDHLGSVNVITDGAGKITDLLAFDPWGKRRAESNWTSLSVSATQSTWFVGAKPKTSRGFTGHQMADEMEIIHMGGRIYDPLLGRFLQADPFVQSPSTTASLNRYSYVWNNPLNATDPSGFSLSSLWKDIRPFVGAIVGVVLAVTVPWAAEAWAPIVIGMISGAAGAAANGTSIFKGAMFGAFSGMAYMAGGVLGSAIWGGMEANMNGGAFGRGFVAAGIGAMGGAGGGGPSIKGFVTSAVLGGVATEVTGGKFKNGAASAAFMYAVSAGVQSSRNVRGSNSYAEQEESEFYTLDKNGNKIQTPEQRERQLKHHGIQEGRLSSSETKEISAILATDEFKATENLIASAALECRCEPTALRVTEIEGLYFIDKIGAGTSGLRIEGIPKPLGFKNWRHVFDWHPHPGGTPLPSLNDLLTSQSQGTNNVIWYGESRHKIYKGVSR